jgi:hypothetical protein
MKLIFVMRKKLLQKFLNIFFQMFQIFPRKLLRNYFKISAHLFYFRSFIIPLSDGKDDRHLTSTVSVQSDFTTKQSTPRHRTHKTDE